MIVGIDLGTTYSSLAILVDDGPVVLTNGLGERLTPSAVSVVEDGSIVVGAAARSRSTTHPERTALSFKRDMGTDRKIRLGDRDFHARELSALVLGSLKSDAEAALGQPISDAVITVPAYFGELARQHTREAAELAGLCARRIVNEPTAAALVYGLTDRDRVAQVVVLDLGGGTFDVTVLEIDEDEIAIRATAGDVRLGGDDFDDALVRLLLGRRGDAFVDPTRVTLARLRASCEAAKKRLTDNDEGNVALTDVALRGGRGNFEAKILRAEAEAAWASLLDRMRGPIDRALRDAKTSYSAIDEVLLVGGATRMPCVRRLAADLFGRLPLATLPPDLAVAMGAAVQAGLLERNAAVGDLVMTDVAPFTLGISSSKTLGRHRVGGLFAPIIERGTVLPASRTRTFTTIDDLQTSITFNVFQGEHALCRDNTELAEFEVKGLKPRPAGDESVEVRFTYDENGLLEIDFAVVSTGAKETHLVASTRGRLSPEELESARTAMQRLKVSPRDEMPNTATLARAEALFVELIGPEREELGEAIAMFRASLETGETELIDDMRRRLTALVERGE